MLPTGQRFSSSGPQVVLERFSNVLQEGRSDLQQGFKAVYIQMVSVHFFECVMAVMLNFKEWPYTAYQAVPEALNF